MILLKVPFSEKDQAKSLGARWNPDLKCWFIPDDIDETPFSKWIPSSGTKTDDAVTLSDLLFKVSNKINDSFPNDYWVKAEITNMSSGNHTYLDLAEYDANKTEIAKSRATIWHSESSMIFDKFKEKTGEDLSIGINVLVLVKVNFHPQYGLSLNISDIDPAFTIGAMQAKINEIVNRLKKEGVYLNNSFTELPLDFTNIAVISPESAAGLGDFRAEADLLQLNKICDFTYYSAIFQGNQANTSIASAFNEVSNDNKKKCFDAIVLIRGGGSKSDLHFVNEYNIARCITDSELPVMVGIGHEQDSSVLDLIAKASFDTPSKVINYIFNAVINNAMVADDNYKTIARHSESIIKLAESEVTSFYNSIFSSTELLISNAEMNLTQNFENIKSDVSLTVSNSEQFLREHYHTVLLLANGIADIEKERLQGIIKSVLLSSPITNLNKGYSIVSKDNNYIASVADMNVGDNIDVRLKDGSIKATITNTNLT